jgi:hypothetical protein
VSKGNVVKLKVSKMALKIVSICLWTRGHASVQIKHGWNERIIMEFSRPVHLHESNFYGGVSVLLIWARTIDI